MEAIVESARRKGSVLVVGLDPDLSRFPTELLRSPRESGEESVLPGVVREFCLGILEATAPFAAAVKLQSACFELLGAEGVGVYSDVIREAERAGLPTIADVKRGDIDASASAYAGAHLSRFGARCVTVNPYMGADAVKPFLDEVRRLERGGGTFTLVATSNPSSVAFQEATSPPMYEVAARLVADLGQKSGDYTDSGAVVGVTRPAVGARVRELLPEAVFLAPGFGAQGGGAAAVRPLLDRRGGGVIVNSSRAILYAHEGDPGADYREAAASAAKRSRDELREIGAGF